MQSGLSATEKMTFGTKVAYGAGDVGGAIIGILLLSYLSPFLTDVAHLAPGLAGATQLIVRVWDACIDPVIGIMSDRGDIFGAKIKAKWGRRYPWMIFSAIPFGFFFVCQWLIPFPATNQWGLSLLVLPNGSIQALNVGCICLAFIGQA